MKVEELEVGAHIVDDRPNGHGEGQEMASSWIDGPILTIPGQPGKIIKPVSDGNHIYSYFPYFILIIFNSWLKLIIIKVSVTFKYF